MSPISASHAEASKRGSALKDRTAGFAMPWRWYGKPTGWIVVRKNGRMIRVVSPEFATEAEAIEYAAGVPVSAPPRRIGP